MKLLIAVDHSEASQAVLKEVAARPWPSQSSAEVLTAIGSKAGEDHTGLVQRAVDQLRAGGLAATGVSLQGDAKRVILDRAEQTKPDFVLVGSHGGSALSRILGSVSSSVMRHAACSVEIVRATEGKPAGVRKILLATDGSQFAERAARSIAERPWPSGTEVLVLSVVELHLGTAQALFEPPGVDPAGLETQREDAMKRAQSAVSTAGDILAKAFPKITDSISILLDGPKNVIIQEADQNGVDLIVVGSHGHSGIERFLLGSVSEGVALQAHCSVEVIR